MPSRSTQGANRVVVTGVGVASPLGNDFDTYSKAVLSGTVAVKETTFSDPELDDFTAPVAAADDFDVNALLPDAKKASMDRIGHFAVYCAREAMASAGVTGDMIEEVIFGSSNNGIATLAQSYDRLFRGTGTIKPLTIPKSMANAPVCAICMDRGIKGPSYVVSNACSSSNQAMILAAQKIRCGAVDVVLTGGAEANLIHSNVWAWRSLGVMSQTACRPFCKTRDGLAIGEGGSVFVFENRDHAIARGAPILAEVLGWGETSDAGSLTAPSVEGIAAAIGKCLDDSDLAPGDIDYVNCHGTGTEMNDLAEASAIAETFGLLSQDLPVSSTKSMHGHLLGGAGAIEFSACLASIADGRCPPNQNYAEIDDRIPLNLKLAGSSSQKIGCAINQSFAFGGHNAVLAVAHPDFR